MHKIDWILLGIAFALFAAALWIAWKGPREEEEENEW